MKKIISLILLLQISVFSSCGGGSGGGGGGDGTLEASSYTISESSNNDGLFSSTITLTLTGNEFTTFGAKDIDFGFDTMPSGFDYSYTWESPTEVTLEITGLSREGNSCTDGSSMTFVMKESAFRGGLPDPSEIVFDIEWVPPIVEPFEVGPYVESGANDGTFGFVYTQAVFTRGGTFVNKAIYVEGVDFRWDNLPPGLTTSFAVAPDGTSAAILLDGSATDHAAADSTTATITFLSPMLGENLCDTEPSLDLDITFFD